MKFDDIPHFPDLSVALSTFQFGLEAEFLLVKIPEYRPLWYQDLSFAKLNSILEGIEFKDIRGNMDVLEVEPPHKERMPFVVEGYHVPDENFKMIDILPKGIEIRTPVCSSIEECLQSFQTLFIRLQESLRPHNLQAVCLSHHPTNSEFFGKQNKRRYDYWQWAMEVMTTYGPDINVSAPTRLLKNFDKKDFEKKVNFYAPALTALSVGSPFINSKLWKVDADGGEGQSYRTYKRSIIAPPIEFHPREDNRFEFKVFEMSPYLQDYHNFFLLFLVILLENRLWGRSEKAARIYEMGDVAKKGLGALGIKEKLDEILTYAPETLKTYGFDPGPLQRVHERIAKEETLASELIGIYKKEGSLSKVLEHVSYLRGN